MEGRVGLVIPLSGLKNHTPYTPPDCLYCGFSPFPTYGIPTGETDSLLKSTILVGRVSILFLVFSSFLADFRHFLSLTGHLD